MLNLPLKRIIALLSAWLMVTTSPAQELHVSGFITQGLTYTSDYDYFSETDDNLSPKFTEAALNLNYNHTESLRLTAQGAYRNSYAISTDEFYLDLLQIDAQLYNQDDKTAGIKLGRFKLNYGLYSHAVDVPAAWPTALISDVAFFSSYRSGGISMDGLEIYWQQELNDWSLNVIAQAGDEVADEEIYNAFFFSPETQSKYNDNDDNYTARINLASPDNSLLLGWDYWHITDDIDVALPQQIINKSRQTYKEQRIYLQKYWQNWQLDTEYILGTYYYDVYDVIYPNGIAACNNTCQNNLDVYFNPQRDISDYTAAYINLYRHFANGFSLYGGYGVQYDDTDDKNGKELAKETGSPAHIAYMKQSLLGFRFELDEHWSMAAMASYFEGTANLEYINNPPNLRNNKYWHLFHINLSYSF